MAACGAASTTATFSPSQLLAAGKQGFERLSAYHIAGQFMVEQQSAQLSATVLSTGDASGTLTLGSDTAKFIIVNRAVYFDTLNSFVTSGLDADTAYLVQHLKGSHWWRTGGPPAVQAALRLLDPNTIELLFLGSRKHLSETAVSGPHAVPDWRLDDAGGSVFVTRNGQPEVAEVKTAENFVAGEATDLDLTLDQFNQSVTIAPPPSFVPATYQLMPPYYFADSASTAGECRPSGCSVTAVIKASAGNGGPVSVTIQLEDKNHNALASCTTTVTLSSIDDSQTASCFAGGSGWTRWYYAGAGTYFIHALPANPDYNT